MSNCAIVGINWGDEGKGRMVDLLTADYDVVVRYQGGGNAGHRAAATPATPWSMNSENSLCTCCLPASSGPAW